VRVAWAAALIALALAACEAARNGAARADPPWPGIRFDPAALRSGDRVGELVAESVSARHTPMDSTSIGSAHFRGEIELSGQTMRHPDPDMRAKA
jgi:hypothetical protein